MGISSALLYLPELEWWDPAQLPACGQMPLQPWGSLQISSADVGLPDKPGKSHWSPCLAQKAADNEQQPTPARGAGWWEAALAQQLAGAGKALPAHVSQCCSGRLGRLGLLEEAGSSLTPGRGGGSRQQPHKQSRKRPPAPESSAGFEKQGVSSLLRLCHFSITRPRSVGGLYLRLPPSLNKKIQSTLPPLADGAAVG